MGSLITFILPVAPYHLPLVERAVAQVAAQTIPVDHIVIIDESRMGAGAARNRGVERAQTPFIAFLDADDFIQPDFAEKMLSYWQPGFYIYSDWIMSGEVQKMTDYGGLWNGLHHLINCLMLKADFISLRGFNETIEAEDTEFWLRAHERGLCGKRCPHTLVEYTGDGQRSRVAQLDPDFWPRMAKMYKEIQPMACAGCDGVPATPAPKGVRQPEDVLVLATWGGNQTRVGVATGRLYPRNGNGMPAWVDPRDAAASPDWYKIVDPIEPATLTPENQEAVKKVLSKVGGRGGK